MPGGSAPALPAPNRARYGIDDALLPVQAGQIEVRPFNRGEHDGKWWTRHSFSEGRAKAFASALRGARDSCRLGSWTGVPGGGGQRRPAGVRRSGRSAGRHDVWRFGVRVRADEEQGTALEAPGRRWRRAAADDGGLLPGASLPGTKEVRMTDCRARWLSVGGLLMVCVLAWGTYPAEAAWTKPRRIGPSGGNLVQPEIAASGASIHVVYRPGGGGAVHVSSSDCGDTWSEVKNIPRTMRGSGHQVAVVGTVVHLVWTQFEAIRGVGGTLQVLYRRSEDSGRTWMARQRLSSTAWHNGLPSLAVHGNDLWVAWPRGEIVQNRFRATGVVVARSHNRGRRWRRRAVVGHAPGARHPRIAVDPDLPSATSRLHLVWEQEVPEEDPEFFKELLHRESRDGGRSWSAPERVNDRLGLEASALIAVGGAAHVARQILPGFPRSRADVFYYRKPGDGAWSRQWRLSTQDFASGARLAGASGRLWAVWTNFLGPAGGGISVRRSRSNGARWARPHVLQPVEGSFPAIAMPVAPVGSCAGTAHLIYQGFAEVDGEQVFGLVYQRNPRKLP